MMYDSLFSRSFSKHEQKRLSYGAFIGCFLIVLSFCTVFKPYLGPLPILNLRLSIDNGLKMLRVNETSTSHQIIQEVVVKEIVPTIICNMDERRSDFCELSGDIRINKTSASVYIVSSQISTNNSWKIRPYSRKGDMAAMGSVREWSVNSVNNTNQNLPSCTKNHNIPAILFSVGGYAGNHFHSFTDIIIPLFLTSRKFDGEVQFLITNKKSYWIKKFGSILKSLSNYELIDIDDPNQEIHCFSTIIVGLRNHKELGIDASREPYYSMKDFRELLRSSYSLKRSKAIRLTKGDKKRPRLLIIARKRSRVFTNLGKIARMAKRVGFEIVVAEPDMEVDKFSQVVNSCDVLMGVHGAGLTNILFLPDNAILIQVLPLGAMKWLSQTYFGEPSKDMNLRYLEYEIREKESSLMEQYSHDDVVIRDPRSISSKGWVAFRSIYLDKQNVKLDVKRFRNTLVQAFELLHQ